MTVTLSDGKTFRCKRPLQQTEQLSVVIETPSLNVVLQHLAAGLEGVEVFSDPVYERTGRYSKAQKVGGAPEPLAEGGEEPLAGEVDEPSPGGADEPLADGCDGQPAGCA